MSLIFMFSGDYGIAYKMLCCFEILKNSKIFSVYKPV